MKRREFIKTALISAVTLSFAPTDFLTPSPVLTGRHYTYLIADDLECSHALTEAMLDTAIHYFKEISLEPNVYMFSSKDANLIRSLYR